VPAAPMARLFIHRTRERNERSGNVPKGGALDAVSVRASHRTTNVSLPDVLTREHELHRCQDAAHGRPHRRIRRDRDVIGKEREAWPD
jgi:hypothetical protein